jgi:hypothetical protein
MTDTKPSNPGNLPTAEDLRMRMLEHEMAEMEKQDKLKKKAAEEHSQFTKGFLTQHFTEHERDTVLRLIRVAIDQGKTEALIFSFPSDLCSDGGRAINNAQPEWPDTLQGKARELYDRYVEVAKPRGYKLKAMIINFPGGIPGDVGFYLSW